MKFTATDAEMSRAKKLHSVLLFDFIVIHIFLFVLAISMIKSTLLPLFIMVALSLASLAYVMFTAQQSLKREPSHFVRCHQLLAAKRARLFLILFVVTGTFTAVMFFGGKQLGFSPIAAKSLAFGIGQLPFMVSLLVLVVLEFDAEHQCKSSQIPSAALALHPSTGAVDNG
ncbi:MAG: hypothetical protein PXX73_06425 [Sideroxydans sp.]|nr:hypothetical protein [Sideroxydans sp.]